MSKKCVRYCWTREPSNVRKLGTSIYIAMYEQFNLFEEEDGLSGSYRAWYSSDDGKITYNLHYITAGIDDLLDTMEHEWLHALFDWATIDDPNRIAFNVHDCTGDSDHFIMKVINFYD